MADNWWEKWFGGGLGGSAIWSPQQWLAPYGQPQTTQPLSPYQQYQQAGELDYYPVSKFPNEPYSIGGGLEWVRITHDPVTGTPLPGGESWVRVPTDIKGAGEEPSPYMQQMNELDVETARTNLEYLRMQMENLASSGELTEQDMAKLDMQARSIEADLYRYGLENQAQMTNIEMLRQRYYNEYQVAQQQANVSGLGWLSGLAAQPKNWLERWYAEHLPQGAEMPPGLATDYSGFLQMLQGGAGQAPASAWQMPRGGMMQPQPRLDLEAIRKMFEEMFNRQMTLAEIAQVTNLVNAAGLPHGGAAQLLSEMGTYRTPAETAAYTGWLLAPGGVVASQPSVGYSSPGAGSYSGYEGSWEPPDYSGGWAAAGYPGF